MKLSITIFFICFGAASAFFFGKSGPDWSTLKVTWGINPFSKEYFVQEPLSISSARDAGFQKISTDCNGKFLGQRYIKDQDIGLILIYDVQGTIAGVQMAIPASMVTEQYYKFSQQKMFNRDTIGGVDAYVLTAYFVDPKTICQTGRSVASIETQGVGAGLWLQNGSDPIQDSVAVPLDEKSVSGTKWVKGACFPTMGVHYWYDNRLDADCELFFPAFLLYNGGKLTGFGWDTVGRFDYTKRTEFPPLSAITSFLKPVPTCMPKTYNDAGGFTTMHLYFTPSILGLTC